MLDAITAKMETWLKILCADPTGRSVGTLANREASMLFIDLAEQAGARVASQEFDCMVHAPGQAELVCGDRCYDAQASPFSKGCEVSGILEAAATMAELRQLDLNGKVLLLHGEIASSQIMPKNFRFYNPEEHQAMVSLLEDSSVLAVITASPRQPELNGALYPTPMFEDGDLSFASLYMSVEEGTRLLEQHGRRVKLISTARQLSAKAIHALAAFGPETAPVILICSHLDTKMGTPGALDNAGGTMVLFALLELLKDYQGPYQIQIMPFNGEDYYAVPGEMLYLRDLKQGEPRLCVNLDAVGLEGARNGWCHFNLNPDQEALIGQVFFEESRYGPMPQWFQGDHAIFAMQGVPTIAFCTQELQMAFSQITHSVADRPELLDLPSLADLALRLREFIDVWQKSSDPA